MQVLETDWQLYFSLIQKLLQQIPETERKDMIKKRGSLDLQDLEPGRVSPRPKPTAEPIPDRDLSLYTIFFFINIYFESVAFLA